MSIDESGESHIRPQSSFQDFENTWDAADGLFAIEGGGGSDLKVVPKYLHISFEKNVTLWNCQ